MSMLCKICASPTTDAGTKWGAFAQREFHLRQCPRCHFSFVSDPCTDYERIYSAEYYRGQGADPRVNYTFELEHPDLTVREYEWRGIHRVITAVGPLRPGARWLDFGCGAGGLVRFCRSKGIEAFGFDEGAIVKDVLTKGIPFLSREQLDGQLFDVVTAIEVLEHVEDPIETLRLIRSLLKPGGLFFFTTGNAAPFRQKLASWSYVLPEVHVNFFEPRALEEALMKAGFGVEFHGYAPGFTDIIRFKILKNLGIRVRNAWEKALPWPILSRLADLRYHVSGHPAGRA
jgi:SAM-dependent methyltransferase